MSTYFSVYFWMCECYDCYKLYFDWYMGFDQPYAQAKHLLLSKNEMLRNFVVVLKTCRSLLGCFYGYNRYNSSINHEDERAKNMIITLWSQLGPNRIWIRVYNKFAKFTVWNFCSCWRTSFWCSLEARGSCTEYLKHICIKQKANESS